MKKSKRLIGLLMSSMLLAGAVSGCSSTSDKMMETTGTPVASTETTIEEGKTEGDEAVLNIAKVPTKGAAGDKVDYAWENPGGIVRTNLFRTLFLADSTLKNVEPDLAESWTVAEDGLTYTIQMKEGLKWSDGEDLTAADVVFSIKTCLKAAVSNGLYTTAFGTIKGADAWKDGGADLEGIKVDGNTITISLDQKYGQFIEILAQFPILPEHSLKSVDPLELNNDEFWGHPVSSGRFMVTEMNAGNYFIMEQNPYYEGPQANINKIVNYFVTNYVTAAQSGQIDFYNTNAPDEINQLSAMENMTKYPVDILFYRYFICNMEGTDGNQNPVMQDPRVREAILHAIDREELAKSLFPDLANVVNSGVQTGDSNSIIGDYEYNPEKAKQLLEEAGYDFNHTFRILYYYKDQTSVDFIDAVAYYLGEIGMKVETTMSTQSTTDLFQTRNYDIGYKGLSAFGENEWYGEYRSDNGNFKNIFGGDPSFDALIEKLNAESDLSKRSGILKELQTLESEKLYKLPLFTIKNDIFVNSAKVKIPDGVAFANPWYAYDMDFENWEIIN